jgi:hypothetical protein
MDHWRCGCRATAVPRYDGSRRTRAGQSPSSTSRDRGMHGRWRARRRNDEAAHLVSHRHRRHRCSLVDHCRRRGNARSICVCRRTADSGGSKDERAPAARGNLLAGADEDDPCHNGGDLEHHPTGAVLAGERLRSYLDRVGPRPKDREPDRMRRSRHQSTGRCTNAWPPLTARL